MDLIRAFFEVITDAWKDLWQAAKELAEAEKQLSKSLTEAEESLRKETEMKFKVGDRVKVVRKGSGLLRGWAHYRIGQIGTIIKIDIAGNPLVMLDSQDGQWWLPKDSIELETERTEMNALKLDTEAIRRRVLEQAVVVCWDNNKLEVYIPGNGRYSGLVDGGWIEVSTVTDRDLRTFKWLIRPGDEAEFSDDGENWNYHSYCGITLAGDMPFIAGDYGVKGGYRYIRPVQKNEELEKAREEVAEARKKLEQAEKRLEKASR